MFLKKFAATVLLWAGTTSVWAAALPEIDGGLSLQAITLASGVLYLLRKRK